MGDEAARALTHEQKRKENARAPGARGRTPRAYPTVGHGPSLLTAARLA